MVKEWATVLYWHNGRAVLRYGSNSGLGSCAARSTCRSYILNNIGPKTEYQLELEVSQPLIVGQKIEVGGSLKPVYYVQQCLFTLPHYLAFLSAVGLCNFFFKINLLSF